VAGNYVYVADGSSGLRIIDVTNPSSPSQTGFYDTPAGKVCLAGSYTYVTAGDSGLFILRFYPNRLYLPQVLRN
jgi:hypothetical protein